jgi:hypothetical protein
VDNIIVNSALWYAEQSSQFLLNSGANKLLDKGYDYYVKEVIPLGHRLIQNGQIAADAMDGELAAQFSMAYVANYWRAAKTVYNFAPEFLRTLAETEDAPIYSDIMMRLPYRDFVMNLPTGSHHDAMFVHIEFDASHGPNDVDTLFLIVPFKANPNVDNIELCQCMQWCLNGKKLIESYRHNNDAREQAFQNGTDSATVNDATVSNVPGAVLSEEELQKQREFNAGIEPYLRVAVSAAYYLASKNAEIKEVKIPKEKRPVLVSKPGATPKKVNVKTYNVGFVIGKSFEMQLVSGAEYQKSTATGTGRTVRPHVRRAHWHHYWVGEGRTRLEVRWIEPTFVLPEGKREIKIATVRRVMGT